MVQSNLIRIGIRIADQDMIVTALVDTGASINAIHPDLVPYDQRFNSVISSLSIVGGDIDISKEAPFTMYIDQHHTVTPPMSAVLDKDLSTDIFLGLPFLAVVKPFGWDDKKGVNYFWFTFQKKKYYYKVQGRQRISHQLNFVTERKDELSLHEKSLQIQKQLERPTTQKHVQDLAKRFEKVYSEHPGLFWHIKKHIVDLPFDNNFKGVPHRSRAIPMDAEHVNVDTN